MVKKLIKLIWIPIFAFIIITVISIAKNPVALAKNSFSEIYSVSIEINNGNINRNYIFTNKDEISKLLDIADTIEESEEPTETTADIKYTVFMTDDSALQFSYENVDNYSEYFKSFVNVYSDLTN